MYQKMLFVIMLAGVLTAGILRNQPVHYACTDFSAEAGEAADTTNTDKQTEYKITIKKEGYEFTLQKNAEEEIVRLVEESLLSLPCNCGLPWERLESFEKYGMVIKVEYPAGKKLKVAGFHNIDPKDWVVNYIDVLADDKEKSLACNNGSRRYMSGDTYEEIQSYLTSEYIISEAPLDFTAPKTNIKNGKTYKPGKKITFSDKGSGMKYAKLDGKKIKNGHIVRKKGKHKLVLADKAGNKRTVKFTIK